MKIYTKTGDNGTTSLIGGKRVKKYDDRIEAYGTVDELISYLGLIRDQQINESHKTFLLSIQNKLMVCAAILATDCDNSLIKVPKIMQTDIILLENEIDVIEKSLPVLKSFILPGGHQASSLTHVSRNICRHAERLAIKLNDKTKSCSMVVKYLNRLSDYLFVMGRKILKDKKIDEILWESYR